MMVPAANNILYTEIVDVLYEFLGPASERFLDREIKAHLQKEPEHITKEDIVKIHEWSRLAIALLAEDQQTVETFSKNLLSIAEKHNGTI